MQVPKFEAAPAAPFFNLHLYLSQSRIADKSTTRDLGADMLPCQASYSVNGDVRTRRWPQWCKPGCRHPHGADTHLPPASSPCGGFYTRSNSMLQRDYCLLNPLRDVIVTSSLRTSRTPPWATFYAKTTMPVTSSASMKLDDVHPMVILLVGAHSLCHFRFSGPLTFELVAFKSDNQAPKVPGCLTTVEQFTRVQVSLLQASCGFRVFPLHLNGGGLCC